MKFGASLIILSTLVSTVASRCESYRTGDNIHDCNPYVIVTVADWSYSFEYKSRSIDDNKKKIADAIKTIETFENVEENKTTSETSIELRLKRRGVFNHLLNEDMIIYDDGYVTVKNSSYRNDNKNSKEDYGEPQYYYKYDVSKANLIFDLAEDLYQRSLEEERLSDEYNERVANFNLTTAFALAEESKSVEYELSYYDPIEQRRGHFMSTDENKEFLGMIKDASLTKIDNYFNTSEVYDHLYFTFILENRTYLKFVLTKETRALEIEYVIYDKFDRHYTAFLYYRFDADSIDSIMNRAYELRDTSANQE